MGLIFVSQIFHAELHYKHCHPESQHLCVATALKLSATGFYHFTERGQLWKSVLDWDPVSSNGSFRESEGLPVWGCVLAPPHCRTRWRNTRASEVIPWLQLAHLGGGKLNAVSFWMNTKKQSGNLAEMSWLSKASNTSGKCGWELTSALCSFPVIGFSCVAWELWEQAHFHSKVRELKCSTTLLHSIHVTLWSALCGAAGTVHQSQPPTSLQDDHGAGSAISSTREKALHAGCCLLPKSLYRNRTAEQDNTSHVKENISSSINYFPCYSWQWPPLRRKKSPLSFISFIQLPILKPLARMSHIYICYHIILCSISVATCPLFLTTKVCCRKNKQLAATLKDCLPRWQCP